MAVVFEILCGTSDAYFSQLSHQSSSNIDEEDDGDLEFLECLGDAMVALGLHNLHCVSQNSQNEARVTFYLRQVSWSRQSI